MAMADVVVVRLTNSLYPKCPQLPNSVIAWVMNTVATVPWIRVVFDAGGGILDGFEG